MPEHYRALDWLARRRDGEAPALIAWRAGVSDKAVRRATDPFGPFPRPTRQLGRRHLLEQELTERSLRWVVRRRAGERVVDIARAEGVSHQLVSRATIEHGPFPPHDIDHGTQTEWVRLRHDGWTLGATARHTGATRHQVAFSTKDHGPYPARGPRLPPGLIGVSDVARRLGVPRTTALRQIDQGLIPEPDFVTHAGRRIWLSSSFPE